MFDFEQSDNMRTGEVPMNVSILFMDLKYFKKVNLKCRSGFTDNLKSEVWFSFLHCFAKAEMYMYMSCGLHFGILNYVQFEERL